MTPEENLRFHAVLYGVPRDQVQARIGSVLEMVELSDRSGDLVSTFSGGMARRLERELIRFVRTRMRIVTGLV